MYAVPDVDEVVAVAKELGIHLGHEEAVLYRKHLMEQLGAFDAFVQSRLEETKPPMVSTAREPGCRPSPQEDPLNAWTWKCHIEGAAEGPLSGKTVSYKDHIAVAGMPMSFGSFALEGFIPDFDATVVTRVLQLVLPTCLMTAPKNHVPGSYLEAVEDNLTALNRGGSRNTMPFNYTGHPALALPMGKSSAALPISMQLVGRFFDDPLLMRVAYAYQHSTDWEQIISVQS